MVLINIYAIIMINFFPLKIIQILKIYIFLYYFSINAVFHVKIEAMPLKSNFFKPN